MKVEFKKSFVRDLERISDRPVKDRIRETIDKVEAASSLQEINDIKKLRGGERYYRIRIGRYRIGLVLDGDTLIFVRVLHRRDLYRYFP